MRPLWPIGDIRIRSWCSCLEVFNRFLSAYVNLLFNPLLLLITVGLGWSGLSITVQGERNATEGNGTIFMPAMDSIANCNAHH